MSNYDQLMEVEAEIRSKNKRVRELEDEISNHEGKREDSALREAFLEHKEKEVEIYTKKFEEVIKSLEKKRDLFYKSFFDECTLLSEEYRKVTAKLVDEDKKIEKEAEKLIQSSSKNFIGRYLKSLSIFFWKIKERNKIRKETHSRFIKSHNLDEMGILMLDKPLFYLMRTKSRLYDKFAEKYDLGETEKYVFNLNKFNKIDSLPSRVFNILKDEFIDKNRAEFLNFSNIKKVNLDRIIIPLKSEMNNLKFKIEKLYAVKAGLKRHICKCGRDINGNDHFCPKCIEMHRAYRERNRASFNQSMKEIDKASKKVGKKMYNHFEKAPPFA